jgi:hypothetical protein
LFLLDATRRKGKAMEELRGHSAKPTQQEQAWMSINPFTALVRIVALAGIAVAIGVSATQLANPHAAPQTVAAGPE